MTRIGDDVAEQLEYEPGVFAAEPHGLASGVRGSARSQPRRLVASHVIQKGVPTGGLRAPVVGAKFTADLYWSEAGKRLSSNTSTGLIAFASPRF